MLISAKFCFTQLFHGLQFHLVNFCQARFLGVLKVLKHHKILFITFLVLKRPKILFLVLKSFKFIAFRFYSLAYKFIATNHSLGLHFALQML